MPGSVISVPVRLVGASTRPLGEVPRAVLEQAAAWAQRTVQTFFRRHAEQDLTPRARGYLLRGIRGEVDTTSASALRLELVPANGEDTLWLHWIELALVLRPAYDLSAYGLELQRAGRSVDAALALAPPGCRCRLCALFLPTEEGLEVILRRLTRSPGRSSGDLEAWLLAEQLLRPPLALFSALLDDIDRRADRSQAERAQQRELSIAASLARRTEGGEALAAERASRGETAAELVRRALGGAPVLLERELEHFLKTLRATSTSVREIAWDRACRGPRSPRLLRALIDALVAGDLATGEVGAELDRRDQRKARDLGVLVRELPEGRAVLGEVPVGSARAEAIVRLIASAAEPGARS